MTQENEVLGKLKECQKVNKNNKNCPFNNNQICFAFDQKLITTPVETPLIFLNTFENFIKQQNKYKIVLITESPYNFPGCPIHEDKNRCCGCYAENVNKFIENHLGEYGLRRFREWTYLEEDEISKHFPYNIFEFIFYTFYPIFYKHYYKDEILWAKEFINRIYWTHVAKRSLKEFKKMKNKDNKDKDKKDKEAEAVRRCILSLKEELEVIQPDLIIVATRYFWKHFGICKELNKILEKQEKKEDFLDFYEVIDFKKLILCKNSKIVAFPNPSPGSTKKYEFYNKEYVPRLIKKIHTEINNNWNNLPDC